MSEICSNKIQENVELILDNLGREMRKKRQEKQMTQEQLGFICNTDTAFINRVENGRCKNITIQTVIKITIALGIVLSKIL